PERAHRDLPGQRVQGRVPAQGEGRGRAAGRPGGQGGGGGGEDRGHRQVRGRQGGRELAPRRRAHPDGGARRGRGLAGDRESNHCDRRGAATPSRSETRCEATDQEERMRDVRKRWLRSLGFGLGLALAVCALRAATSLAQEASPSPPAAQPATAAAPAAEAPAPAPTPRGPDPTGAETGTAADVPVKDAAKPTLEEVMATVGHNKISINIVWTLLTGFLVMFMQTGFAMVETGFTRAKNAAHTFSMNYMVYPIGMFGYWICGFAMQMGGVGAVAALGGTAPLNSEFVINLFGHPFGLMGTKGFFMGSDVYDVGVFTLFLFQMVFMDTAVTIPTGAMAERWKWSSFLCFGFFMSMFGYPLFGNWVWGGGWLSQLGAQFGLGHGHVDFAGSSVVHMVGGMAALAGAMALGPRIGKYTKDCKPVAMPGHHIPMALVGTLILAFGWFCFKPVFT